jgi:exopolysaccharide biosynthesis polyprenyl glycosylphosphotransferase
MRNYINYHNRNHQNFAKRIFDVFVILLASPVLVPVFILIATLIKMNSKGAVIYKQTRVGVDGALFDFYKFRSMYVDADKRKEELEKLNESKDGVIFKMKDDPRITKVGKYLRKFSLDELPQLYNVLIGDMSLVGPRPPVPKEVDLYDENDKKRLMVTPGITCIWQVSGRSDIPFKEQVQLDIQYIKERSFFTDLRILLQTVPAVVMAKGAY